MKLQNPSSAADKTLHVSYPVYDEMVEKQNFPLAVFVGIAVGVLCAVVWAALTVATEYQIGFFAIAAGAAVGYAIRYAGRGVRPKFGILGAVIAVLSCLVGNFLSQIGFLAVEFEIGYWEALMRFDYSQLIPLMTDTFHHMDILFYLLAGVEGYKLGYRKVQPVSPPSDL